MSNGTDWWLPLGLVHSRIFYSTVCFTAASSKIKGEVLPLQA
jgi:hypothetical protein